MDLLTITERPPDEDRKRPAPLLAHGFRPFFLLAGGYGALFLSAWLGMFTWADSNPTSFSPVLWHGHEMIFGFASAAICGFMLTATSTWSRHPPVTGPWLLAIIAAWAAGRLAMWLSALLPAWGVAALDLALFPALAYVLLPVFFSPGNRGNLIVLAMLGLFFAANLLFHLEPVFRTGAIGLRLGVNLLALLIVIIIGRIVPTFLSVARLAETGPKPPVSRPLIDGLAISSAALFAAAAVADHESAWTGVAGLAAAGMQVLRMVSWRAGKLLAKPHIWALHLGYGWICAGFALAGVANLDGPVPRVSALHAMTVGGIGTTILGVMSIVALLHTGRPAEIPPPVALSYLMISAAALVRITAPVLFYESYREALILSGAFWAGAFGIFTLVYWPILSRPRPDGIPG